MFNYTGFMGNQQQYFIGTSGFSYGGSWRGRFYPKDLPREEWLRFYATQFNAVEINSTFYRIPLRDSVKGWYEQTPSDFVFAVKMYRLATHLKRLIVDEQTLAMFDDYFSALSELKEKLQVLLVQLPKSVRANRDRLVQFIEALKQAIDAHGLTCRIAIEFRHETWFTEQTFAVLRKHAVASVINSGPGSMAVSREVATDFLYLRFHGRPILYFSNYSKAELQGWATFIARQNNPAFIFFNNTALAHAVKNARTLRGLL